MSEPYAVKPDREFLGRVLRQGGEDVKKCYQCATCSVVCELSGDEHPFPRKEMIWTQWGLKDRIVADPDVWLCYQCNDCSTRCPRGARPGDVIAVLRKESVEHYAVPKFLAKLVNDPMQLPLMLLIPAVLLGLALLVKHPLETALGIGPHKVAHGWEYAELFPHWLLIGFFTSLSVLALVVVAAGAARFWRAMKEADEGGGNGAAKLGLTASIVRAAKDVLVHKNFNTCTSHKSRYLSHLGVFYGFLGLLVVTVWAVIVLYIFMPLKLGPFVYPFDFFDPMKIVANLSTIALLAGCIWMIRDRLGRSDREGTSTNFDWIFVWTLLAVVITGILTELARFADLKIPGYGVYFVHLVFVFALLIYLPYSKFAHVVYRFVALVYAEHTGRNEKKEEQT